MLLSLASNCDQEKNLSEARIRLKQVLSSLTFTSELWTDPICAKRPNKYLNQLATGYTTLCTEDLCRALKEIETEMGRTNDDRLQGNVRIDLDLLQYDDVRHHLRDWERPYVKRLLEFLQ